MTARLAKSQRTSSPRGLPPTTQGAISIRPATGADARAIQLLCKQLGYNVSMQSLRKHMRAQNAQLGPWALVGIDQADRVIGFLHATRSSTIMDEAGRIEIGALVVDNAARRQGVGRSLVQAIEKFARGAGAKTIRVRTNVTRTYAHAFYASLGYRPVKVQTVFECSPDRADATLSRDRTAR